MLAKIKAYGVVILGALATVLALMLRIAGLRLKQQKQRAKTQEARADHLESVMESDKEIEREHDKRTEDLAKEIKKKRTSDELSRPNRW